MTIDIVLAFLGIGTVAFTVTVLIIFAQIGSEPSTLVASFFALVTAEAAICWRIHAARNKLDISTDTDTTTAADILEGLDITADPNEEDEVYG